MLILAPRAGTLLSRAENCRLPAWNTSTHQAQRQGPRAHQEQILRKRKVELEKIWLQYLDSLFLPADWTNITLNFSAILLLPNDKRDLAFSCSVFLSNGSATELHSCTRAFRAEPGGGCENTAFQAVRHGSAGSGVFEIDWFSPDWENCAGRRER